jgi:transposase
MSESMVSQRDFRKLDPAMQAELRRVAVGMVQAGKTRIEAAAAVGVNRRFVGTWVAAVERSGEVALGGGRRGRRAGEQKALLREQEQRIRRLIVTQCPDQLGLPFALWTREAVGMLIERERGVQLSRSTISTYLHNWQLSPQRPRKRATERQASKLRYWMKRRYPALARRAKAEGAEIHWGDETGLSNQANYGRSFAAKGQTPIIPRPAKRFSCSMISTLTNRGTLRFMIYDGALNVVLFLNFLRRLVKDARRKIFLIVDNLRVHRAKPVTAWVRANRHQIELVYLPPYAPEYNPDEFMHNDLKQTMARRCMPKDKAGLKSFLRSHMHRLQKMPAKVRAFFQAPEVRYAA